MLGSLVISIWRQISMDLLGIMHPMYMLSWHAAVLAPFLRWSQQNTGGTEAC